MSEDEFFGIDDDFDVSALQQLDAIEAAALSQNPNPTNPPIQPPKRPAPLKQDSSFCDITFNIDDSELQKLDNFIEDAYQGKAQPVLRPSTSNKQQTTLFGDVLQPPPPTASSSKPKPQAERTKASGPSHGPFGHKAPKTKKWDHAEFAKTGLKGPSRSKGKEKETENEYQDQDQDQDVEFEQFPQPLAAPMLQAGPPPPMKVKPDLLEAKHWVFPINRPKRDYQFNIIKHCLFENTLVALPTGLGKTFIAGVVMLNCKSIKLCLDYRWFPEGKVVFVAPTKPLVGQQIDACHNTCGIPAADSVEMTGETAVGIRARHWKEKRVFFMTPQTFVNDCMKETCDIRDIVLLVIDEAHRARGGYAYSSAVRLLMAKNPYHRILALSATPGNKPEIIQELVDALHISRIELRDERSLDLKPYIFEKTLKTHIIKPNAEVERIRAMFVDAMDPIIQQLQRAGLMRPNENAVSMHHFRPQALGMELKPNQRYLYPILARLANFARGMMYLLTGSIGVCYTYMKTLGSQDVGDDGKKKNKTKDDAAYKTIMNELELQKAHGFAMHPKIEKLKNILIQHFGSRMAEEGEEANETRVMVFSSYRNVVEELVVELKKDEPLIRPARFIGQGTDTMGNKGLPQKEQLGTIKKFQDGEFNVLVATSIGEEGLDIGDVDLTICYDADKAPTRMVQRFGRTGRKRAGVIHALLAEHKEENNIEKAEAQYREVQKVINKGENYELYGDVERLIPEHIKPQCIEKVVEIEQYDREEVARRVAGSPKRGGTKRKRNDDVRRNMPMGVASGFVPVSELLMKGSSGTTTTKKRKTAAKAKPPKDFDEAGEDDEDDEDIVSGRVLVQPRRTQSAAGPSTSVAEKPAKKGRLKKAATDVVGGKKKSGKKANRDLDDEEDDNDGESEVEKVVKPKKKKPKVVEPTLSQFSRAGEDDSDDMDIERGAVLAGSLFAKSRAKSPDSPPPKSKGKGKAKTTTTTKGRKKVVLTPTPSPPPVRELSPLSLNSTPARPTRNTERDDSPIVLSSPTRTPSPIEFSPPALPSPQLYSSPRVPRDSPQRNLSQNSSDHNPYRDSPDHNPYRASPEHNPYPDSPGRRTPLFIPTSPADGPASPPKFNDVDVDMDMDEEVPDSEPSRSPRIPLLDEACLDSPPFRGTAPRYSQLSTNALRHSQLENDLLRKSQANNNALRYSQLNNNPLRQSQLNNNPLRYSQINENPTAIDDMSWIVAQDDDEDDNLAFEIVDSSPPQGSKVPPKPKRVPELQRMTIGDESIEVSMPMPSAAAGGVKSQPPKKRLMKRVSPDVDDSVVIIEEDVFQLDKGKQKEGSKKPAVSFADPEDTDSDLPSSPPPPRVTKLSPIRPMWGSQSPPPLSQIVRRLPSPGSPPLFIPIIRKEADEADDDDVEMERDVEMEVGNDGDKEDLQSDDSFYVNAPSPTQPVGRAPKRRKVVELDIFDSPLDDLDMPPPSQRRLYRLESTPLKNYGSSSKSKEDKGKGKAKAKKSKRTKPSLLAKNVNPLFDGEAAHSGDEVSEGFSGSDEEDEEDRMFIKDSPISQASTSYDQSAVYRRSLQTQIPWGEGLRGEEDDDVFDHDGRGGPLFAAQPVRARPFGNINGRQWNPDRRYTPSSSPPLPDEDLDRYDESFVVDDDAEIIYDSQAD